MCIRDRPRHYWVMWGKHSVFRPFWPPPFPLSSSPLSFRPNVHAAVSYTHLVGDISDIYVTNFNTMMGDTNFTVEELSAIAFGYNRLLEESSNRLLDLKEVTTATGLSMTDKERPVSYTHLPFFHGQIRYVEEDGLSRQPVHHADAEEMCIRDRCQSACKTSCTVGNQTCEQYK